MLKREILLTGCAIVLALSGQEAKAAETCATVPTCEELGYTKTDCGGRTSLKCPFDKTKLFCGTLSVGDVIEKNGTAIGVVVTSNLAIAMTEEERMTWTNAIAACKAKTTGGMHWRLPTSDDFEAIRTNYEAIRYILQTNRVAQSTSGYWTSDEANNGLSAWFGSPGQGSSGYYDKLYKHDTICVTDL